MASTLLALLDDITTVLDDVALLTKVAAKKTAGVVGDDLALNAKQVSGVHAERELPVVWAVAKGSFVNKCILVPLALLLSALAPWAVMPLLMLGGAFLCYEGVEKLAHRYLHSKDEDEARHAELAAAVADGKVDLVAIERGKIKGAIRTDFVLSAEIIAITLGTVATARFASQVFVLSAVAVIMTAGVYGLVAGIVKIDDLGVHLLARGGRQAKIGAVILRLAPWLMKGLTVAGTVAMFTVGGGILVHGIAPVHHLFAHLAAAAAQVPSVGGVLAWLLSTTLDGLFGVLAGAVVLAVVSGIGRLVRRKKA